MPFPPAATSRIHPATRRRAVARVVAALLLALADDPDPDGGSIRMGPRTTCRSTTWMSSA
jgi:hypothetical protein